MDRQNKQTMVNLQAEIDKFADKSFKVMFFVPSTKGEADDNVANIYKLALATKKNGYDVVMLYSEKTEEFATVETWMGDEYAELEHMCVNEVHEAAYVSPSDTLIIPDIMFPVLMKAAQAKLPCQKILIAQDIRYVFDSIPFGQQLATYGVEYVIALSENAKNDIKTYFPAARVDVLYPGLNEVFYDNNQIRDPYVMILTEDQDIVKYMTKGFYLKYPIFRFVSFKDSCKLSEEFLADALRKAALVVFDNTNDSNGENILKALRCGCAVMAKIPEHFYDWMATDSEGITEAVYWYPEMNRCIEMIAGFVENYIEGADVYPEKKDVEALLASRIGIDYVKEVGEAMDKYVARHKSVFTEYMKELKKEENKD